ncbi:MAG: Na+/H+ antiporter subunit B [Candidatus Kapabacteria bacterium]|nr:Na+/H+ antiporter subunit B [Ignavibacteriota bacterium]MCW5886195.1 Na+/H+ antiporter subunit B [Candidatus Kapabacteria bacterium]
MKSIILQTAVRYIVPLMLLFSFFVLLRGHNEPGGGFVGGLVAAIAYSLYVLAFGIRLAKRIFKYEPINVIILGLSIALLSSIIPIVLGYDFMTGIWGEYKFPILGKLGTPFLFDIGVYFVVLGISLKIIFTISEEVEG